MKELIAGIVNEIYQRSKYREHIFIHHEHDVIVAKHQEHDYLCQLYQVYQFPNQIRWLVSSSLIWFDLTIPDLNNPNNILLDQFIDKCVRILDETYEKSTKTIKNE